MGPGRWWRFVTLRLETRAAACFFSAKAIDTYFRPRRSSERLPEGASPGRGVDNHLHCLSCLVLVFDFPGAVTCKSASCSGSASKTMYDMRGPRFFPPYAAPADELFRPQTPVGRTGLLAFTNGTVDALNDLFAGGRGPP